MTRQEKEVLKFLGTHLLYGLVAGLTFGVAVLFTNLGNLWTLAVNSPHTGLVLTLFFFGLFVTFGGIGMAVGIMSTARSDGDDDLY